MNGDVSDRATRAGGLDPLSRLLAGAAILLGLYLYLGRLGATPIQRGNEGMYASPPIAMLQTGDYLVPVYLHKPFLDKPPLTFWILAASYRLLGVSIFAARLPAALASLATVLMVGLAARRRAGDRAGVLAAIILVFSFGLYFSALVYAADAFLMLAVTIATLALDAACRETPETDAFLGATVGAALALCFYCKGLVGIVLPVGGVALGLLLDRARPVRLWRRGAWAAGTLVLLLAPWHWAMTRRLGAVFWETFYWKNQVLRASTRIYMLPHRGLLYYLGILTWAVFPWSLCLPLVAGRRWRRDGLAMGWLLFGFLFLSVLVMKREVYLLPLYPAFALVAGEGLARRIEGPGRWWRAPWVLAGAAALAGLFACVRALPNLETLGGADAAIGLGVGLAAMVVAAAACALAPGDLRPFVGAGLACGLLLLGVQRFDERLARFDPFGEWGERIRRECGSGCDLFLIGANASSLTFSSRADWSSFAQPPPDLAALRTHARGFVVVRTDEERRLPPLPAGSEVVERRLVLARPRVAAAADRKGAFESLSLIRLGTAPPRVESSP